MAPNPTQVLRSDLGNNRNHAHVVDLSLVTPKWEDYEFKLSPELERLAREELKETEETRRSGLAHLRHFLSLRPHLTANAAENCGPDGFNPLLAPKFLLRFLRSQKFNLEKSEKVLENYLNMRTENPNWFLNLDPTDKHLTELTNNGFIFVLPGRDSGGRRVIVNNASLVDLDRHTNSDVMRLFMAVYETLLQDEENHIRGFTYIFYCQDISLHHLSMWTPADAMKLFGTCEKNLAIRHRDINLVHLPFGFWAVLEFVKNLLSSKIRSRITSLSENKKLAKKLGEANLPAELGGSSGLPMLEMAARWRQELVANKANLLAMDELIVRGESVVLEQSDSEEESGKSAGYWSFFSGRK